MSRQYYASIEIHELDASLWEDGSPLQSLAVRTFKAARRLAKGSMRTLARQELEECARTLSGMAEALDADSASGKTFGVISVPTSHLPDWIDLLRALGEHRAMFAASRSSRVSLPFFLPAVFPPFDMDAGAYGPVSVGAHIAELGALLDAKPAFANAITERLRIFRSASNRDAGLIESVLPLPRVGSEGTDDG